MSGIATLSGVAVDCPDTLALARFYSELSGWSITSDSDETWAQLDTTDGWTLAFQRVQDYCPPEVAESVRAATVPPRLRRHRPRPGRARRAGSRGDEARAPAGHDVPCLPRPGRPPLLPLPGLAIPTASFAPIVRPVGSLTRLCMMAGMDWGIHLPQLGRQATRTGLIEFAQHAEQLGVHSGWVSDHVAWPSTIASRYPYTDDGSFAPPIDMPWLDPIGTMFFVAGCTETLRLGLDGADPRLPTAGAHGQGDRLPRPPVGGARDPRRRRRVDARAVRGLGHALRPPRQAGGRAARAVPHVLRRSDSRASPASSTTCRRWASNRSRSTARCRSGSAATATWRSVVSPVTATPSTPRSSSWTPSRPAGREWASLWPRPAATLRLCACRSGSTSIRRARCRRARRSPARPPR